VIRFFRGEEKVVSRINQLIDKGIGISSVSLAELYHGAEKSMKTKQGIRDIKRLLDVPDIQALNFKDKEAREFGKLMNKLEKAGLKISPVDLLIAVTAKVNKLIILTGDKKHFSRLNRFGIKVEAL